MHARAKQVLANLAKQAQELRDATMHVADAVNDAGLLQDEWEREEAALKGLYQCVAAGQISPAQYVYIDVDVLDEADNQLWHPFNLTSEDWARAGGTDVMPYEEFHSSSAGVIGVQWEDFRRAFTDESLIGLSPTEVVPSAVSLYLDPYPSS